MTTGWIIVIFVFGFIVLINLLALLGMIFKTKWGIVLTGFILISEMGRTIGSYLNGNMTTFETGIALLSGIALLALVYSIYNRIPKNALLSKREFLSPKF